MLVNGLISKLIDAHAVEKRRRELTFTSSFGGYLLWSISSNSVKAGTIQGWREILSNFDSSLANLSELEIEATIILSDYYMNHPIFTLSDER